MNGSLVALLHLCDSLFPLGAFAHSDGLETATSSGRVATADDLESWMATSLSEGLSRLEGPALARAWQIGVPGDAAAAEALADLDAEVYAMRPSASGRESSRAMGARLLKTWRQIRPTVDLGALDAARGSLGGRGLTLPVAFGIVSRASEIGAREALTGFMYTRLAAIVSAAMRLMPVGQHDAHARLSALLARVPDAVETILREETPPRSFAPAMDIAAMRQQYGESRLFRS
jgi:urease accessory protein